MNTKVAVGGSAAAGSAGVPVVVIWLLGLWHVPVPPEVAAVLSTWLAAGSALLFGWLVRELHVPETPAENPQHETTPTASG